LFVNFFYFSCKLGKPMLLTDEIHYKEESFNIIGSAMEVHKEMGNGFLEAVYQEAFCMELSERFIPHRKQVELDIYYKEIQLKKKYYADLICYNKIIIELKAVDRLRPEHHSQVLNYLKATNFKLGILINFGAKSLEYKRFVK
jgi:GxxExxY protein